MKRRLITVHEYLTAVRGLVETHPDTTWAHRVGVVAHPASTESFLDHCTNLLAGAVRAELVGSTTGPVRAEPMRHSFELWDAICAEWSQVE